MMAMARPILPKDRSGSPMLSLLFSLFFCFEVLVAKVKMGILHFGGTLGRVGGALKSIHNREVPFFQIVSQFQRGDKFEQLVNKYTFALSDNMFNMQLYSLTCIHKLRVIPVMSELQVTNS